MKAIVQDTRTAASPKRRARIAGVLYLIVAVFAAFFYNIATGTVYVPGDAAAAAQKVMANAGLPRGRRGLRSDAHLGTGCRRSLRTRKE